MAADLRVAGSRGGTSGMGYTEGKTHIKSGENVMNSFQWDKNFVTGLADVDRQHQQLVDIINQFGNHLAKNEIANSETEEIFRELADYAQHHFREEEALMTQSHVDSRHVDRHIEIHQRFLREITSMHSSISKGNLDPANQLLNFLIHWLAYHILGTDQNMAKQIRSIQSGVEPSEAYETEEREKSKATGPLLVALNGLFEQVSARNRDLLQLNQSLEEKVAQRTKELSDANLQLEELSLTDALTGIPNRRHAMRRLAVLWEESLQTDLPLVCMMIDLDHFKEVNDTHGHDAGDLVLTEFSRLLRNAFRNDDIVCRLGGDEFFIICPNTNQEDGMKIAEITRKTVSELRVPTGDTAWHGSISIGVASRTTNMESYEELIKEADQGVYAAKQAGKNRVRTTS